MSKIRTIAITIVALMLATAIVLAVLPAQSRLSMEHSIRLQLSRHSKVAALDVPGIPGLRMFLNPEDSVITHRIMSDGVWEANETHWVSRFVGEGDTFVDVGANVGYFTIIAATLVGENGRVFAFEPDPIAFEILKRNVALNGLDNVVLEQKAASNEAGVLKLYLSEKNKGDHRIFDADGGRISIDVEAVALDDYFATYDRPIDFVKIDTQGAEGVIVAGMDRILRQNDDIVMGVEFWPLGLAGLGTDAAEFLDLLRSYNLLFFDLGLGVGSVSELNQVHNASLLRRFSGANSKSFTNLLVLRGYQRSQALGWDVLRRNKSLLRDTPELGAAQAVWEQEVLSQIQSGDGAPEDLPEGLGFVIARPAERRTPEEQRAIKQHFRSVTPLLADEREAAKAKEAELKAYADQVLSERMRNAAPTQQ